MRKEFTTNRKIAMEMFREDYVGTTDVFVLPTKHGRSHNATLNVVFVKAENLLADNRLWMLFDNNGRGSKVSDSFTWLEEIAEEIHEMGNLEDFEDMLATYNLINGGNLGNAFESYIGYEFFEEEKYNLANADREPAKPDFVYQGVRVQVKYSRFNNYRATEFLK